MTVYKILLFPLLMMVAFCSYSEVTFKNNDYGISAFYNKEKIKIESYDDYEMNKAAQLLAPYSNYYVLTMSRGAVNSCGAIYSLDEKKLNMLALRNANNEIETICNIRQIDNLIISQQRISAARSTEKVLKIDNNIINTQYVDSIIGDTSFSRLKDGENFMVSPDSNILARKKMNGIVISDKAYFYDENFNKMKSYLIRNDRVIPVYYSYRDGQDWVKVNYKKYHVFMNKQDLLIKNEKTIK